MRGKQSIIVKIIGSSKKQTKKTKVIQKAT